MARPKSVTIKLTPKQREQLRKLTGNEHTEVLFESVTTRGKKVAAKASLARKTPLSGKGSVIQGTGGVGMDSVLTQD
jgi:hypothetical protein